MSLLNLNENMLSDELLEILCKKHIQRQFASLDDKFIRYMEPCTDISYILKSQDKFALGECWDSIGGYYAIKILPYTTPQPKLKYGYYKDGYLLQEINKISNILSDDY